MPIPLHQAYQALERFLHHFERVELRQVLSNIDPRAVDLLPNDIASELEWLTQFCERVRDYSPHGIPGPSFWSDLRALRPKRVVEIDALEKDFESVDRGTSKGPWRSPVKFVLAAAAVVLLLFALWRGLDRRPREVSTPNVDVPKPEEKQDPPPPGECGIVPSFGTSSAASPALAGDAALEFVRLTGGSFCRGSAACSASVPDSAKANCTREAPVQAHVASFELATTELTQGQWRAVTGEEPRRSDSSRMPDGDRYPAYAISWFEAVRFANRLTDHENARLAPAGPQRTPCYVHASGQWVKVSGCTGYRLPSESEWEYAARAGTTSVFAFGDADDACKFANFGDVSYLNGPVRTQAAERYQPGTTCSDADPDLAEVRTYAPNQWGLFDMHGNVQEWTADWFATSVPGVVRVGDEGPANGTLRSIRGGGYNGELYKLRPSYRTGIKPDTSVGLGVRLARAAL